MTQIYLDENLSEYVADALNSLRKGYFSGIEVLSTKKAFGKGTPDEDLIPAIGKARGILITRDVNILRTRMQYQRGIADLAGRGKLPFGCELSARAGIQRLD
jgi:hypothetical protein